MPITDDLESTLRVAALALVQSAARRLQKLGASPADAAELLLLAASSVVQDHAGPRRLDALAAELRAELSEPGARPN